MGNPAVFSNLAGEWFGANDMLSNELLKRFLVGAVRRILYTGTMLAKMDTILVLVGKGGHKKTTFLDDLWREDWALHQIPNFDKAGGADISNAIARKAVAEFGEFERIIQRAGADTVKDFASRKADEYRRAYGRDTVYKPRQCAIVANTNEPEWIDDPRGSERRFWPITVAREIPLELVKSMRDEVWAAAVALAVDPSFQHWIDVGTELDRALVARHGTHATPDAWSTFVHDYVQGREFVTGEEVYHMAIALGDPQYRAKYQKKEQYAISKILRKLGAVQDVRKTPDNKKSIRGWVLPQSIQVAERHNAMPNGGPSLSLVIGGK
jgi:predicted P-loop ATPase